MGLSLFKLEKLKIKAYEDAERQKAASPAEWTAMFNPASFKRSYSIAWYKRQGLGSSGKQASYSHSDPSQLDLELLLDGTGVDEMGAVSLARQTVAERIEEFMDLAYRYNGAIHEPNYLLVEWGKLAFYCRLKSVDVTYDAFDRDGTPLRATLAVQLVADDEDQKRMREEQKSSPDLTHSRTVRHGDTLPLLTREVYGSSAHFLAVARANDLDDFRNLAPGRQIFFPPLDRLRRESRPR